MFLNFFQAEPSFPPDVIDLDNTERCWTSLGTSVCLLLKDLSKDEFAEFFMDH